MHEELIRRLRNTVGHHDEKCEGCPYEEDYPCCVNCLDEIHKQAADAIESTSKAYQMMADAYEAEVKTPRWISVEERLPGEKEMVLCSTGSFVYYGYVNNQKQFYVANNMLYDAWTWEPRITHWMPLPEPPKEEE